MRKIIYIGIVITLLVGGGVFFYTSQQQRHTDEILHNTFISATIGELPHLSKEGKPLIEVTDVKKLDDVWYIVTIQSIHEKNAEPIPVKILFVGGNNSERNNHLQLVAGPEVDFKESELLRRNVPDSVILELRKI